MGFGWVYGRFYERIEEYWWRQREQLREMLPLSFDIIRAGSGLGGWVNDVVSHPLVTIEAIFDFVPMLHAKRKDPCEANT